MIAVDTNLLVYSHRPEMQFHREASAVLKGLAEGREPWAIPWPCVHEFLAVVTNRKIFVSPTAINDALLQVALWMASPSVRLLAETGAYFSVFQPLVEGGAIVGARIHDARIVAICLSNGAQTLYSSDRDFSRFTHALDVKNPLTTFLQT